MVVFSAGVVVRMPFGTKMCSSGIVHLSSEALAVSLLRERRKKHANGDRIQIFSAFSARIETPCGQKMVRVDLIVRQIYLETCSLTQTLKENGLCEVLRNYTLKF